MRLWTSCVVSAGGKGIMLLGEERRTLVEEEMPKCVRLMWCHFQFRCWTPPRMCWSRSFAADPGLLFVLPDGVAREQLAPTMARAMLQFVVRTGTSDRTWEPVRGVALWFPPGASPPSEEDFSATGRPFSGEKLSPVLAFYRADSFADAAALAERILRYQGTGHSLGLHTRAPRARSNWG